MTTHLRTLGTSLLYPARKARGFALAPLEQTSEQREAIKRAIWQKVFGVPNSSEQGSTAPARIPLQPRPTQTERPASAQAGSTAAAPQTRRGKNSGSSLVNLDQPGYLRLDEVLMVFPVSRAAWYEGVKNGKYPSPVKLGKRAVGYRTSDIRALIESPTSFAEENGNG